MNFIKISIDGRPAITVRKADYVRSKTKDLQEFGYRDLTESAVAEQLEAVLAGKTLADGLSVIGGFIEGDIVIGETK